jgi:AcrR family transcriptional regulator
MAERLKKDGEKGRRGRTGPVTAEAVIDAALVVIDEEGLDALTMRRLAHDLGVEPVTIYRQLPSKDAILGGVAEKLWSEVTPREPAPGATPVGAPGTGLGGAADDLDRAGASPSPPHGADWREQVRGMWLALNGLMQAHPNAIPIIARGGSFSTTAGEGTLGMLSLLRDAGLSPREAAELLHVLSACVVGFGFATLWGSQIAAARQAAAAAGGPVSAPPDHDDLSDYVAAAARWDPSQFAAAVDIVLDAYGDGRH